MVRRSRTRLRWISCREERGERGSGHVVKILIVEDNDDLRDLLADVLADAGFDVMAASNGAEALERGASWQPDALVIDLMMPVMDGPTFLRVRQNAPGLASLPVLVLTAHPYHFRALDGLTPTAVLRKPYDLDELIAAVEALSSGDTGRGHVS